MEHTIPPDSTRDRPFRVCCVANDQNRFAIESDSLTVTVGQRIRREDHEEMWDSVSIYAKEDVDGTLIVQLLVFNPDWDEPLQIACLRSRPRDRACLTALGCNLDHVTL